jgi:[protein-PII] uridylyltransferase
VEIRFNNTGEKTVIQILGSDILGFLYSVTSVLSNLDIQILNARISTRGDVLKDSFVVENKDGGKLLGQDLQQKIRQEIDQAVQSLSIGKNFLQ